MLYFWFTKINADSGKEQQKYYNTYWPFISGMHSLTLEVICATVNLPSSCIETSKVTQHNAWEVNLVIDDIIDKQLTSQKDKLAAAN